MVKKGMKEVLLCATAFSLTITLGHLSVFNKETTIDIDHESFRLMECESLIEMEGNETKAAAECVFGGYYPLGPSTQL